MDALCQVRVPIRDIEAPTKQRVISTRHDFPKKVEDAPSENPRNSQHAFRANLATPLSPRASPLVLTQRVENGHTENTLTLVATTTAGRISNRITSSKGEHNTAQTVGNSNANNGNAKGEAMMGTRTVAVLVTHALETTKWKRPK